LTRPKIRRYHRNNACKKGEVPLRLLFALLPGLYIVTAALAPTAYAQSNAVYRVTYVEVMPGAIGAGTALLKQYGDASSRADGNLRADSLQEIGRANRFVIVEAWRDKAALDGSAQGAASASFRNALAPLADAPQDERITNALYVAQGKSQKRADALYVVTHVDVIPAGKDECMAALKAMSADSASDAGNIGYEVLQQANRGNHFTVVEAWSDRNALDAHAAAAHTRAFRDKLAPIAGALYDERIYKALN
jgi:quinol monooxygenase YgiN